MLFLTKPTTGKNFFSLFWECWKWNINKCGN